MNDFQKVFEDSTPTAWETKAKTNKWDRINSKTSAQ